MKGYIDDILRVYKLVLDSTDEEPSKVEELFFTAGDATTATGSASAVGDNRDEGKGTALGQGSVSTLEGGETSATGTKSMAASTVQERYSVMDKDGYKLFMTIGLLGSDQVSVQTLLGDRATVRWLLATAFNKENVKKHKFVKWGCWALFVSYHANSCSLDNVVIIRLLPNDIFLLLFLGAPAHEIICL